MNTFTLNRAFQYVDDKYLDIVEQERIIKTGRSRWNRFGTIAACIIGLILILGLPAAAIAANWFGLRDLLMPVSPDIPPVQHEVPQGGEEENTTLQETELPMRDFIGLSGFSQTAEAQALKEWRVFLEKYDPDQKILSGLENGPTGFEQKYGFYTVYTQEMADKLEEILQKYNLKLHTERTDVNSMDTAADLMKDFVKGEQTVWGGYFYEDGSFHFECAMPLEGRRELDYQLIRNVKGSFCETMLSVGYIEDYKEIPYTTADGSEVMLDFMPEGKSMIYMETEECFIFVNVLIWDVNRIVEKDLKDLADSLDFGKLSMEMDMSLPEDVSEFPVGYDQDDTIPPIQYEAALDEEISKSSSEHYLMVTSLSDEEVENFAAKVKEQILESDFAGLAEEIAYPITIDGVTYKDASAFLEASMTLEMNPDFLTELESESCREMFVNYQGIMMGNGIVWIGSVDGELKVIGINGMTVQ